MLLNLGIPKGSLQESTLRLLASAGYKASLESRSYSATFDDPELTGMLVRAQEIPRYVDSGALDAGLTGRDWVEECGVDVVEVDEIPYSKSSLNPVRWVVAVPEDSPIRELSQVNGKVVATELVNVTELFLRKANIDAKVEFSWGATEVKPPHLADAIVELTETGSSLRANRLVEIATVMESVTVLIAHPAAWQDPEKKKKIQNIALLLKGAVLAQSKVGLKMNIRNEQLQGILELLPALKNPTVSQLSEEGWCALESVVDESVVREIIPQLKEAGAEGIIEFPLSKIVP